ncbi:PREDICTED: ribonuclease P protein subunit p14 isoform X1 [Crocodylus porosus]|uniref:ribonuclease P protein subunit p14 isoform X1 n=1 Tax=Crocodylus porosus TaxID=8502 RepID=UPI00093DE407|nr:PREDICTED: ribonuclease P protein subunit p14 isoform X1 [Crocodylus porosus]
MQDVLTCVADVLTSATGLVSDLGKLFHRFPQFFELKKTNDTGIFCRAHGDLWMQSAVYVVGAALPVDVLTYDEKTLSAILRVSSSGLVKLWSALTLLGSYQNRKCAFRVVQTSPFLLALSGNSRELVLD